MNFQEKIKLMQETKELTSSEINIYWKKCVEGDNSSHNQLKYYYMKKLNRIKPLYSHIEEDAFYSILEQSVDKALDRGIKFHIDDFESYIDVASQTYFKYFILPETNSQHIPAELIRAFSKLEEVYEHIPILLQIDDQKQIQLLSKGFEYPIFSTRLLYYSFKKWKDNNLRQVDIDLSVALLPAPQRIEWEIFYEKDLKDIEFTIIQEIEG